MRVPKPSGNHKSKTYHETRMPASASMAAPRKQRAGSLMVSLERLMESKSAFCLRSSEFGQGVDRAGVRSIESKSMSTATLNGTSQLKSPSVNGITRKIPVHSADANSIRTSEAANDLGPNANPDSIGVAYRSQSTEAVRQPSPLAASTIDVVPAPPLQGRPENGRPDAEPDVSIRDQIHEAFERVAFSCVCTLEMLLAETRERGIDDDDVRNVISGDETNLSFQMGDDHQFRCCRSAKGHLFIERDTGSSGSLASIHELFADLKGTNTVRTPDGTQEDSSPESIRQTRQTRAEQFLKGQFDHNRPLRIAIDELFNTLGLTQCQQLANINALGGKCLKDLSTDALLNLQGSLAARMRPEPACQPLQTLAQQFPRGFELSDLYPFLTENQRTVLVVARTIEKKFARGRTVNRSMLRRLCHRYHGMSKNGVRRAIQRLLAIGVVGTTPDGSVQLLPTAVDVLTERQSAELQRMQSSADQISPLLEAATKMLPEVESVADLITVIDRVGILLKA